MTGTVSSGKLAHSINGRYRWWVADGIHSQLIHKVASLFFFVLVQKRDGVHLGTAIGAQMRPRENETW